MYSFSQLQHCVVTWNLDSNRKCTYFFLTIMILNLLSLNMYLNQPRPKKPVVLLNHVQFLEQAENKSKFKI